MRYLPYVLTALTLAAQPSAGQKPAKPPQRSDSGPPAPAAETPSRHSLSQFVRYAGGRSVSGATVVISAAGEGSTGQARVAITDSSGSFTFDSLPDGPYDLQVVYPGGSHPLTRRIALAGNTTGDLLVPTASEPRFRWILFCLLLYLATIMLARWHSIASSLDEMLKGQISALRTRLETEVGQANALGRQALLSTIDKIEENFSIGKRWTAFWPPSEFLFWSRGRENAAWVAIHEVERELAAFLAPPERVVSYLQVTDAQLRVINNPPAIAVADAIRVSLASKPDGAAKDAHDEAGRALLARGITLCYDDRDNQFSTLMEWHNKASWLILAALIIIGFLAVAVGHAVLFLAGAAGGFLSRVMRALRREDLPLDYGASWTTLFLSPVFGALAAWFGVAIITMATLPKVNLLGDAFKLVDWDTPTGPVTLAAAFLLGFSERFFDAVVGAVERHAEGAKAAEEAAKAAGTAQGTVGQVTDRIDTPNASKASTPSIGGLKLVLPDAPLPVQTLTGKVLLDKPAAAPTAITLSTSHEEFVASPDTLTIPAGEQEAEFEIIPKGQPPAGDVRVTARVGNLEVSHTIGFQ